MLRREAARYARQHLLLRQSAEAAAERGRQHDALESLPVLDDRLAQLRQRRRRRPPESAGDESRARLEVEVEAGAAAPALLADPLSRRAVVEPEAEVRLVR